MPISVILTSLSRLSLDLGSTNHRLWGPVGPWNLVLQDGWGNPERTAPQTPTNEKAYWHQRPGCREKRSQPLRGPQGEPGEMKRLEPTVFGNDFARARRRLLGWKGGKWGGRSKVGSCKWEVPAGADGRRDVRYHSNCPVSDQTTFKGYLPPRWWAG